METDAQLRMEPSIELLLKTLDHANIGIKLYHLEDFNDLGSFRFIYANEAANRLTGTSVSGNAGRLLRDAYPELMNTHLPQTYRSSLRNQTECHIGEFEYGDDHVPLSVFSISTTPLTRDILAVYFENVTQKRKRLEELRTVAEEHSLNVMKANKELKREIEERKKAEAQLHELQSKLEIQTRVAILSEISTALANEINSPLTSIIGYTHGCKERIRSGNFSEETFIEAVDKIEKQSRRVANTITRVRDFLQPSPLETLPTDINQTLTNTIALLKSRIRSENVKIGITLHDTPLIVNASPISLTRLLTNLITNAIEAYQNLPERSKRILINVDTCRNYVCVHVEDWGAGFSVLNQDKLSDYFFTTKKNGLGLGLSISQSILEHYRGKITLTNKKGGGVIAIVKLPLFKE